MRYVKFLLEFPNGYHASDFRLTSTNIKISSDVLFSALVHETNSLFGESGVKKFVNYFNEDKLRISDLFPFIGDELFVSKPLLSTKFEVEDIDYHKSFKKIEFIPLKSLSKYNKTKFDLNHLKKKLSNMGNYNTSTKIKYQENGEHEIYSVTSYKFREGNGLYFIVAYEEDDVLVFLDEILYSLSFSGIGGKRTLGYGKFEYIYDSLDGIYTDYFSGGKSYYILINTSVPTNNEINEELISNSSYKLVRKGGFTLAKSNSQSRTNFRKKDVYLFDSGSVFRDKFNGQIIDVGIGYDYPIYRYAFSMFMGVDYD